MNMERVWVTLTLETRGVYLPQTGRVSAQRGLVPGVRELAPYPRPGPRWPLRSRCTMRNMMWTTPGMGLRGMGDVRGQCLPPDWVQSSRQTHIPQSGSRAEVRITPQPGVGLLGRAGPVNGTILCALTQCQGPIWLVLFLLGMSGQQH